MNPKVNTLLRILGHVDTIIQHTNNLDEIRLLNRIVDRVGDELYKLRTTHAGNTTRH